jgi:WD40 repeat protein
MFLTTTNPERYKVSAILKGHEAAIMCLAFSTDGRFLASGGLDRVRIWSIPAGKELQTPEHGYVLRGPPSSMLWAKRQDDQRDLLIFGTGLGFLVFWRQAKVRTYRTCCHLCIRADGILRVNLKKFALEGLQAERKSCPWLGILKTMGHSVLQVVHETATCSCGALAAKT